MDWFNWIIVIVGILGASYFFYQAYQTNKRAKKRLREDLRRMGHSKEEAEEIAKQIEKI